jgi:concentrative nucleoside transporter, CNT family
MLEKPTMNEKKDPTSAPELQPHELQHNPDPALLPSHQHHHQHLHHDAFAERGRQDDLVYEDNDADTPAKLKPSAVPSKSPEDYSEKEAPPALDYDAEKASADDTSGENGNNAPGSRESSKLKRFYRQYRIFFHLVVWLFFTGWWIASLALHRHDKNWIIPFLLYLAITLRLLFFHVPITVVSKPMHWAWNNTGVRFANFIPQKLRVPAAALLVIAVIIVGSMASAESQDNTRANRAVSLFGLVVFIAVLWATSRNRSMIQVSSPVLSLGLG